MEVCPPKNRNGSGGGLLTAVDPNLNPVQVATTNDRAEQKTITDIKSIWATKL